MAGDYPSAITGCGADHRRAGRGLPLHGLAGLPLGGVGGLLGGVTGGLAPATVKFAMNVAVDGTHSTGTTSTNALTPATEFPVVLSLYRGVPAAVQPPSNVGETRINPIPSGPDLTYLTYLGTTGGTSQSATGFLGGISGCGADGATNEVVFTFRPIVNARIVIDSSESGFGTAVSLHEGLPSTLPANPTTRHRPRRARRSERQRQRHLRTARATHGTDSKIDGDYVQLRRQHDRADRTPAPARPTTSRAARRASTTTTTRVVACGVNPSRSRRGVQVRRQTAAPRAHRHRGQRLQHRPVAARRPAAAAVYRQTGITGNDRVTATAQYVGSMSGNTVTKPAYRQDVERGRHRVDSPAGRPMCGGRAARTRVARRLLQLHARPSRRT